MRAVIAAGVVLLIAVAFVAMKEPKSGADMEGNEADGYVAANNVPGTPGTNGAGKEAEGAVLPPAASPRTAIVTMNSTSDAKQSGTATLTDLGGNKTQIVIVLSNLNKDDTQPANIHAGTCKDSAKEPQYQLNPVVKGRSVTVLNVNMGALIDKSAQSIRVRTDAVTPNAPYAACGELR